MKNKITPALTLLACALMLGCSKNDSKITAAVDKPPDKKVDKPALSPVQSAGSSAAAFHKNISSLDKVGKTMTGPTASKTKIEVGLKGIGGTAKTVGTTAAVKPKATGGAPTAVAGKGTGVKAPVKPPVKALAKRGLFKSSADALLVPDSTWFSYADSAKGSIYQLHVYGDNTGARPYTAKDSTAYKWPYDALNPVVLATSTRYKYADGGEYSYTVSDADGDGILNGAAAGKTVRLKKVSLTVNMDTTSKTIAYTAHGRTTVYDSLGDGAPAGNTDSTFIKGVVTAWDNTYDADGDGLLNTSASGAAMVKYDAFGRNDDGTAWYSNATYGPGPDKDYNAWADNIYYPFSSYTVGPKGDTLTFSSTEDADGDGILNGAAAGKTVQLKKSWVSINGDTTSKSVSYTDHGSTTLYDSLGDGKLKWSTDSSFVKGKVNSWDKTYDGDGDGFAYTAEAGKAVKVMNDGYSRNADGSETYSSNSYGVGADMDYGKWEDNEQYPSWSFTLSAKGDTIAKNTYDDADGDGFYFNAAKGSINKVSETSYISNQGDYKSYKDSVVKFLNDITIADDDQVTYDVATVAYKNGSTSIISTKAKNGKDVFGEKDTIEVKEMYTYTDYVPTDKEDHAGDQDSTIRITWMIPNKLNIPDDDQVVWWSSKTYYKKSMPTLFTSEVFTAKVPVLSGKDPEVGTMVNEERFSASADHDVARHYRLDEFDNTKNTASWRDVSYFVKGDSTEEIGSLLGKGIGTYSKRLDAGTWDKGWYNSNSNEFKDTLLYLNAKGTEPAMDISWGTYKDEDGTGDYSNRHVLANGDTSVSRTVRVKEGTDLFRITEISGKDTNSYKTHKDTTIWEQTEGTTKTVFSSISHDDRSYTMIQSSMDVSTSAILATGEYTFWPDGSGSGSSVEYVNRVAQPAVALKFDADGTSYVNGVKVPTEADATANGTVGAPTLTPAGG